MSFESNEDLTPVTGVEKPLNGAICITGIKPVRLWQSVECSGTSSSKKREDKFLYLNTTSGLV